MLLEELIPKEAGSYEMRDLATESTLLPQEVEVSRRFVKRRLLEFATGRQCARGALARIGYESIPVLIGNHREPIWPSGLVGSITHTEGYCAAVALQVGEFASIGIDAEIIERVESRFWETLFVRKELEFLSSCTVELQNRMACLLFSAKEAFYKCQFQISRRWVNFSDVCVTASGSGARLQFHGIECGQVDYEGSYALESNMVLCCVVARRRGIVLRA